MLFHKIMSINKDMRITNKKKKKNILTEILHKRRLISNKHECNNIVISFSKYSRTLCKQSIGSVVS
jgi:hypothetical protein